MDKNLVFDNKYIIQNPNDKNCLLVALANLLIHDNTITTDQGFDLISKLTKKFNANKNGIQPLLIGQTLYEFNYEQCLVIAPGDIDGIERLHQDGWLGIRVFTTNLDNSNMSYPHFVSENERIEYYNWSKKFRKESDCRETSKSELPPKGYGAHAVFYYNFVNNGEDTTVDAVNLTNIISKCKWLDMGTVNQGRHVANLRAIGSQMCIMARKKYEN